MAIEKNLLDAIENALPAIQVKTLTDALNELEQLREKQTVTEMRLESAEESISRKLELLRERINKSGYGGLVGKRGVLTGGASQLAGLPEAARRILGRNVRIGRPLGVAGLPEAAKGPAFSVPVGLLIYPQVAAFESRPAQGMARFAMTGTGGRLHRMSEWLRDSF